MTYHWRFPLNWNSSQPNVCKLYAKVLKSIHYDRGAGPIISMEMRKEKGNAYTTVYQISLTYTVSGSPLTRPNHKPKHC